MHFLGKLIGSLELSASPMHFTLSIQYHFYKKTSLIGLKLCLELFNNYTTSPSFLRADSQRGTAELTIAHRKRGRVGSLIVLV